MATLVAKRKRRQLYYYIVESARVDGKPRIVHQTYLGTAERIAALVQDRTAPLPLSITTLDLGLPGALWRAAQQSGVWGVLEAFWQKPPYRSLHSTLSAPGRDSAHLSAGAENGSGGLVSSHHSVFALGFPCRALHLAGILGCFSSHPDWQWWRKR